MTLEEVPIPQGLIDERWEDIGEGDILHCKIHDTTFCTREEPCWECYDEVQKEPDGGGSI